MPLARLENFLKNLSGNTLYVDPNELDATDSIENRGNSRLRPFKTIQRALVEAARFAYIPGSNNDLFDQTTVLISPGTHYIDNRPGYYYDGANIRDVNGAVKNITELSIASDLNLNNSTNELYIYNSVDGGVIIPKGVSIVATDLRKTKIRPRFVPDPENDSIQKTAIFRLTGGSYIFGFSILDGDPLGSVYNTYTVNRVAPSYSHHKLTAFEYADGKNVYTKNGVTSTLTDLETYYYKLSLGFGGLSGREVPNNLTSFQPNPEENKIVGDLGQGFIEIDPEDGVISGNGTIASQTITVTTQEPHGLTPLTPILITGVGTLDSEIAQEEYNGVFIVAQVTSATTFTYILPEIPDSTANPSTLSATVKILSDTVSSSSPYVFNCSLKSVYGMNGLHADGLKATGFKSMVTAQFTGISLQRDDRAFVRYNDVTGTYQTQSVLGSTVSLHQQSTSIYRPEWETFHIKASNDAFIQCVSIFAIGYAKQFIADDGGDQSVTNSNSNFGAVALTSRGFKNYELSKDDHAFITHIIPPKDISDDENDINYFGIDVGLTTSLSTSNGNTRVYLKGYDDIFVPPSNSVRKYILGARDSENIYYTDDAGIIRNALVTPNYQIQFNVDSVDTSTSIITVENTLSGISTSQPIRFISNTGILPDGIENDTVYYVHQDLTSSTLRISDSITNSTNPDGYVVIKNNIGISPEDNIIIYSKVADSLPGQPGHPIQWDSTNANWYLGISTNSTFISNLIGSDSKSFSIKRKVDTRTNDDKLYRLRLVIPKESTLASEPSPGFIIEKSSQLLDSTYSEDKSIPLNVEENNQLRLVRNKNIISDAWYESGTATIVTSNPHKLKVGNKIKVYNLKSVAEPIPVGLGTGTGYNGEFEVASVVSDVQFTYSIPRNPGGISTATGMTVANWMDKRVCASGAGRFAPYTILSSNRSSLPYFTQETLTNDFQIYKVKTIKKYVENTSDGIYHVILNSFKNTPDVTPFNIPNYKLSQNIDNLYPELDLDNPISDPDSAVSYATRQTIGKVIVNDPQLSTAKESVNQYLKDNGEGFEVTSITSSSGTCTLTTNINHGLNGIRSLGLTAAGSGYTPGTYYDIPLCSSGGTGEGATVKIIVSGAGTISLSNITIMNPGSGYGVGEALIIRGIPGSTSQTTLTVGTVFTENIGAIQVLGSRYPENNGVFPIESATKNTVQYINPSSRTETSSTAIAILTIPTFDVSSVSYNALTDTTTINTTTSRHPFLQGNKVIISDSSFGIVGTTDVVFVNSVTQFVVKGDYSTASKVFSSGIASQLKDTNSVNENIGTRLYPFVSGYRTRVNNTGGVTTATVTFNLAQTVGLSKGDFIQINDEIMLITAINSSVNISVKRGVLGTLIKSHDNNAVVRKVNAHPIELRRNSIIRASGHTFEYTGFGPGNYSTGMPTNQDRVLSNDEVLISQSLQSRGGLISYTGMNSNGEFFIGRKKYDATTGEEVDLANADAEEINFIDDLTTNKITINREIDADTAKARFREIEVIGISTFSGNVIIKSFTQSNTCDDGALTVYGGVGIDKNLNVCGSLDVTGIATVNALNINTSGIGEGDLGSNGGNDGIFGIFNTTNSGTTQFFNKDSGGTYNDILSLTNSTATVDGELRVTGDIIAFYSPSDINWKNDIELIPNALNKVLSISGNTFNWNEKSSQSGKDVGVIAQEIQSVLPEAVIEREDGHLSVSYQKLVPLLIEAIKELKKEMDELKGVK